MDTQLVSEPTGIVGYESADGTQAEARPRVDFLRILQFFFIVVTVVIMFLVGSGCGGGGQNAAIKKADALYLIPQGYVGPVLIVYEQQNQPKLPESDTAKRVYAIPTSGVLLTSSPYIGGLPKDNYHWQTKDGKPGAPIASDPTGMIHGHTPETLKEGKKSCWVEWFFVDTFDNIETHRYALEVLKAKHCGLKPPPQPVTEAPSQDDTPPKSTVVPDPSLKIEPDEG